MTAVAGLVRVAEVEEKERARVGVKEVEVGSAKREAGMAK